MSRAFHWLFVLTAVVAVTLVAPGQTRRPSVQPFREFPPDIFDNRAIDVVKIAPDRYSVQMENSEMRVLKVRLGPEMRVPTHGHNSGLLVAVTEVHLRLTSPDGRFHDIHLPAGESRWLNADTHSEVNLAATPCSFLFIEAKRGQEPHKPGA